MPELPNNRDSDRAIGGEVHSIELVDVVLRVPEREALALRVGGPLIDSPEKGKVQSKWVTRALRIHDCAIEVYG